MSLITRCPTCETMFKVVPDQLRVSEGWVRCGHCAEVFDASQNLLPVPGQPMAAAAPPSRMQTPAAQQVSAAQPASFDTDPVPRQSMTENGASPGVSELPDQMAHAAVIPDSFEPPVPAQAQRVVVTPPGVDKPRWLDAPETDPQTALVDTLASTSSPAPQAGAMRMSGPAIGEPTVSFLHDDDKPSFWQRRSTRVVLLVLLLALLAALGVQILLGQRDRIAAFEPSTRPVLLALCAWQGCSLAPLRQIESVVIDSSSFSRIRGDDYRLGFSLKNNAPVDIAMPAVELALTDPLDRPVIRRVILPAEFGADSDSLAHASVWNGSIALTVKPIADADRISGYRLLAFYP